MIAALYVESGGTYYGLDGVEPWDIERDARRYAGPWPVVAHPPCARWCRLAPQMETLHGYRVGDDGGCFEAALAAVRRFGGVLEHPAHSLAWAHHGLPEPLDGPYWTSSLLDPGYVCEVSQAAYGHKMAKETWLYYVGPPPPALDWSRPEPVYQWGFPSTGRLDSGRSRAPEIPKRERSTTPPAFRDALLALAASVQA